MSSYGFPKKAEDSAAASGDDLCPIAVVRKDGNDTALTGTDGDYTCLSANDVGNLKVQIENTRKATYVFSTGNYTPPASATDTLTIQGSGTKTVKIRKIIGHYTCSTSAANTPWVTTILRRTTANSGGTSSSVTGIPLDSASSTVTAVVKTYTANAASLGTAVSGNILVYPYKAEEFSSSSAVNGVSQPGTVLFDDAIAGAPLTLRGTSEYLCINLGGVSQPGGALNFYGYTIFLTEE